MGTTSTGRNIGPNYANICVANLKNKFLGDYSLQPFVYKRFIDVIFLIWPLGEEAAFTFI